MTCIWKGFSSGKRFKKLHFNLFWVRFEGETLLTTKQPRKKNEGLIKSGALRADLQLWRASIYAPKTPSMVSSGRLWQPVAGHKGRSNIEPASSGSTQGLVAMVSACPTARDCNRNAGSPVRGWCVCPSVSASVFAEFIS